MCRTLLGLAFLLLALSTSPAQPFPSAPAALLRAAPAQETFTFWFEVRGLVPAQAEAVGAAFARVADDAAGLAAAGHPADADLIVRMSVGAGSMDLGDTGPGAGTVAVPTPGAEIEAREPTNSAIQVYLNLVDILDGGILDEQQLDCPLPPTQGRGIAEDCLHSAFTSIAQRMEEWVEREAAVFAMIDDFGPSDADRKNLDREDLARAYYREGVRASHAGFEEQAMLLMAEAQPLFRETGLRREEGATWEHMAYLMAVTYRGPERAISYAEQTVRIARQLEDEAAEARGLNLMAACEARAGDYERAARIAKSAAGRARAGGDSLSEAMSTAILAGLAAVKGDFDAARALQADALAGVRASGNERAEARLQLAIAVVTAQDDGRDRSASLAQLEEVRARARQLGGLALLRDVTFVTADTRFATSDFKLVLAGEVDAIRAFKLTQRLGDGVGEAAAIGLLGAFAVRLGKMSVAHDYLTEAVERARDAGFREGTTDSVQLLGEISADPRRGTDLLESVIDSRVESGDLRGQVKTWSDISRMQSGLERREDAWEAYRRAATAAEKYVALLQERTDQEDVRGSLTTVLKSLMTTRTDLPFLAYYLRMNHMIPLPNPAWVEG